eukprot:TRINITY_DN67421_c5_g1_i1.p1 TRINITY_DN67421_c5_g1~~TRINITY_DN67421_c5_g1_i1.p1  ORF type:complete len:191 (-),score=102.60 TRINITY_DN67421_c5_g1_i1:26-598(-)
MVRKWIRVASHCYELRNFNTLFEIMTGLGHNSVYRLRTLFEELPDKTESMYDHLGQIVHYSQNYRRYRQELRAAVERGEKNMIPYLGVMLRDLVALEEGGAPLKMKASEANAQDVLEKDGDVVLVNFEKCVKITDIAAKTLDFRHSKYSHLTPDRTLQLRLLAGMVQALNEEELVELSVSIKPLKYRRNK